MNALRRICRRLIVRAVIAAYAWLATPSVVGRFVARSYALAAFDSGASIRTALRAGISALRVFASDPFLNWRKPK